MAEKLQSAPELKIGDRYPPEYKEIFTRLWLDPYVQNARNHQSKLLFPGNLDYFLPRLEQLFDPKFSPNDQDCLHVRWYTTGINETRLKVDNKTLAVVDVGGQRSERRKWIHVGLFVGLLGQSELIRNCRPFKMCA